MRLGWIAAGCLIGFGCDKVLGLQPVAPDAPTPDAPLPTHYTIDYTVRTVSGSAVGLQTVEMPYDPVAFIVRLADGSVPPLAHTGPGTFEFDAFPQPYEVQLVRQQDAYTSRVQHTATALHLLEPQLGRPDAVIPTDVTQVDFTQIPITSGTYAWDLYSTGVFASLNLGVIFRGSQPVNWQATLQGLVDYRQHDRLYYVEYKLDGTTSNPTWGYVSGFEAFESLLMQQGSAVTNQLGSAPTTPVTVQTRRYVAPLVAELQRIAPTLPPNSGSAQISIGVAAIAGDVLTSSRGLAIAGAGMGSAVDVDTPIHYANPIDGTVATGVFNFVWSRPVLAPGAYFTYPFRTQFAQLAPPYTQSGSAGETATVANGVVGVLSNVTVAGTPLAADDTMIEIDPTANAQIAWTVATGSFDYYQLVIYEVAAAGYQTFPIYVDTIQTTTPAATIQSNVLQPGHHYAIVIDAVLGVPLAAQGDFRMSGFPAGYEVYVPGTFTPALPKPPGT